MSLKVNLTPIKFGTDGWRAVIAREFTVANVERVAQAAAGYFLEQPRPERGILVSYDSRFASGRFAAVVAEVLCGNGLRVRLTPAPAPTPAVSWGVKHFRAAGAVVITSSHNPAEYNGFKLKADFGGSALPEATRRIEALLDRRPVRRLAAAEARRRRLLADASLEAPYLAKLADFVDLGAIRRHAQTVVFDAMHGSGAGYLTRALDAQRSGPRRCRVVEIREGRDPLFGGVNPEPIAENLAALMSAVRRERAGLGIAVDGDSDRVGLVDERGRYVSSHKVLALLIRHFVRNRGERGPVAKTISGTFLIDRMCARYGLELTETPIGFKHLGELLLHSNYLIAGEESGGMGYRGFLPERDGVLTGLLLLELTAVERKTVSQLIDELTREFGPFHYHRIDTEFPLARRQALLAGLQRNPPAALDGVTVAERKDFDGVKFILADGSWLLIRPSGTEPLLRIYSESPRRERVARLLEAGKKLAATYAK